MTGPREAFAGTLRLNHVAGKKTLSTYPIDVPVQAKGDSSLQSNSELVTLPAGQILRAEWTDGDGTVTRHDLTP